MWLRLNDDDQPPSTCPSLLYFSSIAVSGWGFASYTKLRRRFGSEEATRRIQGRVSVHRLTPMDAAEGVFGSSIVGFLLGFSLASSYAAYRLVDDYKQASAILQASVEELQATTIKVGGFCLSAASISRRWAGFDPP